MGGQASIPRICLVSVSSDASTTSREEVMGKPHTKQKFESAICIDPTMRRSRKRLLALECLCLAFWTTCVGSEAYCYTAFQHYGRPTYGPVSPKTTQSSWMSGGTLLYASKEAPSLKRVDCRCTSIARHNRRDFLISVASAAALLPACGQASELSPSASLDDLRLGQAQWKKLDRAGKIKTVANEDIVPGAFATYLARFLINYDAGAASWWMDLGFSYNTVTADKRSSGLGQAFGRLSASIQEAVHDYVTSHGNAVEAYGDLLRLIFEKYNMFEDSPRHIGILFSTLPVRYQPIKQMETLLRYNKSPPNAATQTSSEDCSSDTCEPNLLADLSMLLPANYIFGPDENGMGFSIQPPISLYQVGMDDEFGSSAYATPFGPLSTELLTRELPSYSLDIYALFGISGATGCALTHSVVIPLDVVKTKAQTDPDDYGDVLAGATLILQTEGWQGLLTGAQATLAGYFWYGLSVYPSYTFFKRILGQFLPPDFSVTHSNGIALVAGALAAVIASLGLTPLEAARIRVVAEPRVYRDLGLVGTLGAIANEDSRAGWRAVYAGLPSLMTRQVIFGSVKFLAFERACEAVYSVWPSLHDATWTALGVSLLAGGFSGAISCIVSQPADAVLTYVAQNSDGKGTLGVVEGCRLMVGESGLVSLFRGLGSRCVWAGSIIAGQFLLYDVFRNYFGVSVQDLTQVFSVEI